MCFGNDVTVRIEGAEPKSARVKHEYFAVIWLVDNHLVNWNGRRTVSFPERLHDPHTVSAPKLRWNLGATPTQCLYHPIRTTVFYLDTRPENVSVKGA